MSINKNEVVMSLQPKSEWIESAKKIVQMINENQFTDVLVQIKSLVKAIQRTLGEGTFAEDIRLVLAQCLDEKLIDYNLCDYHYYKLLALSDLIKKPGSNTYIVDVELRQALEYFLLSMVDAITMMELSAWPVSETWQIQSWLNQSGINELPVVDSPDVQDKDMQNLAKFADFFVKFSLPAELKKLIYKVAEKTDLLGNCRLVAQLAVKRNVPNHDGSCILSRHCNSQVIIWAYGSFEVKNDYKLIGAVRTNQAFTSILQQIENGEFQIDDESRWLINNATRLLSSFQFIWQKVSAVKSQLEALNELQRSKTGLTTQGVIIEKLFSELYWLQKTGFEELRKLLETINKKFCEKAIDRNGELKPDKSDIYSTTLELIEKKLSTEMTIFNKGSAEVNSEVHNTTNQFSLNLLNKVTGGLGIVTKYLSSKDLNRHRIESANFFSELLQGLSKDGADLATFLLGIIVYFKGIAKLWGEEGGEKEKFIGELVQWLAKEFGITYPSEDKSELQSIIKKLPEKAHELLKFVDPQRLRSTFIEPIADDIVEFLELPLKREQQTLKSNLQSDVGIMGKLQKFGKHTIKIREAFNVVTMLVRTKGDYNGNLVKFFQHIVDANGTIGISRSKGKSAESLQLELKVGKLRDEIVRKIVISEKLKLDRTQLLAVFDTLTRPTMTSPAAVELLNYFKQRFQSEETVKIVKSMYLVYLQQAFAPPQKINEQKYDLKKHYQLHAQAIFNAIEQLKRLAGNENELVDEFKQYERLLEGFGIEKEPLAEQSSTYGELSKKFPASPNISGKPDRESKETLSLLSKLKRSKKDKKEDKKEGVDNNFAEPSTK